MKSYHQRKANTGMQIMYVLAYIITISWQNTAVSLFSVIVDKQLGMTTLRNSRLFSTPSVVSPRNDGRFPFIQNFRKVRNSGKWYRNVPEKFSEIPETVEFPKCEPFNRKFQKSRKQSWMESKLPGKIFENLGIPREVVLFCGNFGECFATHIWKLPKI